MAEFAMLAKIVANHLVGGKGRAQQFREQRFGMTKRAALKRTVMAPG
jgi:hypothetical protein